MIGRSQRGQTLVELLVGLAVTTIILGALAGVLYTASDRANHWGYRVSVAANGFALTSALQADAHRYLPCATPDGSRVRFFPAPASSATVTYTRSQIPEEGWLVTRTDSARSASVGRLANQPVFSVSGGAIRILGILDGAPMVVYYRPQPWSLPSLCP